MDPKPENFQNQSQGTPSLHDFSSAFKYSLTPKLYALFASVIVLGLITGYILSKGKEAGVNNFSFSTIAKGTAVGSADTKTFKDQTEGIMKKGGIDGEGAYHLVRSGGDSQNVYLTSSIVDLGAFLDRKVKVWGQTQKAKTAGWLMDVGRVEVLE